MKIALVIGHRSMQQGAYGNKGISEFNFYTEFLNELQDELPLRHEYKIFTRINDLSRYSERMKELHSRIDKWGADLSISFHFNAFGNAMVNGHEILYFNAGKDYAYKLDAKFDKYLTNSDRNVIQVTAAQRGGGFLSNGKSACILIEPFFASHQSDFIIGGRQREPLKKAIKEFIREL